MSAKILTIDIERQGALIDDVWEGKQFNNWIAPERAIEPSRNICFAYRWEHEDKTRFVSEWDDRRLLQDNESCTPGGGHLLMIQRAHELLTEADYVVGWNSKNFDVKHLQADFYAYNLGPAAPHVDLDLMMEVKRNFAFAAKSLSYISKVRGMQGKLKNEPGLRRKLRYADSDVLLRAQRAMKKYNVQDVNQTRELFHDMRPWIRGMNLGLFEPATDVIRCGNCLSEKIQYRGQAGNRTYTYRRFQCTSCGKWGRDRASFKSTASVGIATSAH